MSERIFGNWKPFEIDKKYFLFHLKSVFGSQDVLSFCFDFLVMHRIGLIKKIRLVSNVMTLQPS